MKAGFHIITKIVQIAGLFSVIVVKNSLRSGRRKGIERKGKMGGGGIGVEGFFPFPFPSPFCAGHTGEVKNGF